MTAEVTTEATTDKASPGEYLIFINSVIHMYIHTY